MSAGNALVNLRAGSFGGADWFARLPSLHSGPGSWTAGLNGVIFHRDSIAEAPPTLVAWNVGFLRGDLCCPARRFDFPQPRSRPESGRNCSAIKFYDNSIIHQSAFDE